MTMLRVELVSRPNKIINTTRLLWVGGLKILFYNFDLCEASIFKSLFCTNKNALVFKIDAVAVKMVLVIIINYYSLNSLLHYKNG